MELSKHKCSCETETNKCLIDSENKTFSVYGKAKTNYILNNENPKSYLISKYIVDDCLLKTYERDEKCDYLFAVKDKEKKLKVVYLIECKGSDVLKAVNQIDSTIEITKSEFGNCVIKARIITTRVYSPDLITKSYKNLKVKLKDELETKNRKFEETVKL